MSRSDSESRLPPPDWGTHVPDVPQAVVYAATLRFVGPVKVELAGVAQSTWNFQ